MWKIGHVWKSAARPDRRGDGERPPRGLHRAFALVALTLAAMFAAAPLSRADDTRTVLRVVWASGPRVYVAAPDSGMLAPRAMVRVYDGDRLVLTGTVGEIVDGVLARVHVMTGVLEPDAPLDGLSVWLEPDAASPIATLRLGLPAGGRGNLLIACGGTRLELSALPRAYRADSLAAGAFRWVATDSALVPWPDTLAIRLFGNAADEEIALERGEIDAALFWPGEPSARLRAGPFGVGVMRVTRPRGVLVAAGAPADSAWVERGARELAGLGDAMFGGDLQPWPASVATGAPHLRGAIRWRVSEALPGWRVLERWLDRALPATPRPGERVLRLALLDAPVSPADSLTAAWRRRGVAPTFALQCAVFTSPSRAADLQRMGANALAALAGCVRAERRP